MSNTANQTNRNVARDDPRRANPTGAYVMTAGALLFLIATFLDWLDNGDDTYSGYELDSLIPFTAYLGVGLAWPCSTQPSARLDVSTVASR